MNKSFILFFLIASACSGAIAQEENIKCSLSDNETRALKLNNVEQQWEYKVHKKTKKKYFNSVREFDTSGCVTKIIYPDFSYKETTYGFKEWGYDNQGRVIRFRTGKIDKDSAKTVSCSEIYNYNFNGQITHYRKEFYESEMAQTVEKRDYSYNDKGEIKESVFSFLRVRKDTIANDEIKYSANNTPVERSIYNFFPKGFTDYARYNGRGLLAEYILYEKGIAKQHRVITYQYDNSGNLTEERILDGVEKKTTTRKYEKDKIVVTLKNNKGKTLKTSTESLVLPKTISFPQAAVPLAFSTDKREEKKENQIFKEKTDKKKNKIIETYIRNQKEDGKFSEKLTFIEKFSPAGLRLESNPVEADFYLSYEYAFY